VKYVPSNTVVGVPIGTVNIVAGLYISKAPSTSYAGGVNLALSGVTPRHPLANCRLYYFPINGFRPSNFIILC